LVLSTDRETPLPVTFTSPGANHLTVRRCEAPARISLKGLHYGGWKDADDAALVVASLGRNHGGKLGHHVMNSRYVRLCSYECGKFDHGGE
jgi:hypothetical protein